MHHHPVAGQEKDDAKKKRYAGTRIHNSFFNKAAETEDNEVLGQMLEDLEKVYVPSFNSILIPFYFN